MKSWFEMVKKFLKREWFLLIMIGAISIIVILFELL